MFETDNRNYQLIEKAIAYLDNNYEQQPSLVSLASAVGVSVSHLQRTFTQWAGVSPKQFLQYLTKQHARVLIEKNSILETSINTGLSSASRLHDIFIRFESVTPGEAKTKGEGLDIYYGFHPTPFGDMFVAVTERGICKLTFYSLESDKRLALEEFRKQWSNAKLIENQAFIKPYVEKIFSLKKSQSNELRLLLSGTPFQLQVWQALIQIPEGELCSYNHIAQLIDNPRAIRAVGTAIGANPIAYLIPCHRVIRATGALNNYRWGAQRKAAMIAYEQVTEPRSNTIARD